MSQDDQEALAAQWAAQLEEEEAGQPGGDAGAPEAEAGDAGAAAGDQERSPVDDETLAAQWAEALAEDEEDKSGPSTFGGAGAGGGGQTTDAHFKDMTEMSRQPRDNKLKRELDFILDIPLDVSAELGRTRLLINELLQ